MADEQNISAGNVVPGQDGAGAAAGQSAATSGAPVKKKRRRRRKPAGRSSDASNSVGAQISGNESSVSGSSAQSPQVSVSPVGDVAVKKKKRRRRKKKKLVQAGEGALVAPVNEEAPAISEEGAGSKPEESELMSEVVYKYQEPEEENVQVFPLGGGVEIKDENEAGEAIVPEEVEVPTPKPVEEPAPELAEEPAPELAEEPAPELAEEPAPEPAEEPAPEPAEEPAPEPVKESAEEVMPEEAEEPAPEPVEEPAEEVMPEEAEEPAPEPAEEPAPEETPEMEDELEATYGGASYGGVSGAGTVPPKKESWAELMERSRKEYESGAGQESEAGRESEPETAPEPEEREEAVSGKNLKSPELKVQEEDVFEGQVQDSTVELLEEKKPRGDAVINVLKQAGGVFAGVFNLRVVIWIVVSVALIAGGIWAYGQKYHEKLAGLFTGGEGTEIVEPLEVSDTQTMNEYGVAASLLFGSNLGSSGDYIPEQIFVADFFGTLSEPRDSGETGISAATYYGELMDEKEIISMFVEYVRVLDKMQNLYNVDVYALLDKTVDREIALSDYLQDLKDVRDEAKNMYTTLTADIDALTISYNSLGPDKDKFEDDFFASLEKLESEKSDYLLKAFVDASQKQVALKARVAALDKLSQYYDNAFKKLENRISAVEKNSEALVRGIRVVDVPGSGIDLIIKAEGE